MNKEKALANLEVIKQAIISGRQLLVTTTTSSNVLSDLANSLGGSYTYSLGPQTITGWAIVNTDGAMLACYTNRGIAEDVAKTNSRWSVVELKGEL